MALDISPSERAAGAREGHSCRGAPRFAQQSRVRPAGSGAPRVDRRLLRGAACASASRCSRSSSPRASRETSSGSAWATRWATPSGTRRRFRPRSWGRNPARPDEGFVTATTTRFSVALVGGRLGLSFSGAPSTERLPRVDAGCELTDYAYFLPPGWPDAGALQTVTGLVTVGKPSPRTAAPAGCSTRRRSRGACPTAAARSCLTATSTS